MRLSFSKSILDQAGRLAVIALAVSLSACASRNPLLADAPATPAAPTVPAEAAGAQVYAPTGLAKFLSFIAPYHVSIQQGNFVSQEMVAQLKEGMSREQVRFLLGTALLTDMFHEDRWDYPFRLTKSNGEQITSRVTVYFKSNLVERYEGGNLPNEKDYLARITESALGINRVESVQTETPKKK